MAPERQNSHNEVFIESIAVITVDSELQQGRFQSQYLSSRQCTGIPKPLEIIA